MTKRKRNINVIGINSYKFDELSSELQDFLNKTQNIAVPYTYIEKIKEWFDPITLKGKNFFASKSDKELITWITQKTEDIIIISRGDPLWFGIGRILLQNFPKEELLFYPSTTCVQKAFSQLKIPWQNATCLSVHGRDTSNLVKTLRSRKSPIAIITDHKVNGLELIRENLRELKINDYELFLCEDLSLENERIRKIDLENDLPKNISDIYIIVLIKKEFELISKNLPLFGIEDNVFRTFLDRPNLMTKRDVRIQILADLELPKDGAIWDIGAGSGSIGLEAIRLRPSLKLFSIDKRLGCKSIISENAKRLNVHPEKIIEDDIDIFLKNHSNKGSHSPSRVIIGGCKKDTKIFIINYLAKIITKGCIVVIPIITYEVLQEIIHTLKKQNFKTSINLIQTYKSLTINDGTRFEPNNPIFIVKGKKF
tara:strand:- start:3032 stop:4306 length:1275 start_codon:yes stop_codon:yes gene_type:complete